MIFILQKGVTSTQRFFEINSIDPGATVIVEQKGASISSEINNLLFDGKEKFAVLLSSDVILPEIFLDKAGTIVQDIQNKWPSCAALVAKGLALFGHGYTGQKSINHLIVTGYEDLSNFELPVSSASADFVLLDLEKIRSKMPKGLPEKANADFDIWFCLELALSGVHVIASPAMTAFVPEASRKEGTRSKPELATTEFVINNFNAAQIESVSGSFSLELALGTDLLNIKPSIRDYLLEGLSKDKAVPGLTVVTRTQFGRLSSLNRCLFSILSFASSFDDSGIQIVLVSDKQRPAGYEIPAGVQFVQADVPAGKDSRFLLVGEVVSKIHSDYYLFIDDDDWAFPNSAERLKRTLSICPPGSVLFADAQQYLEGQWLGSQSPEQDSYSIRAGSSYLGSNFVKGLSGRNYTPFCGVVLPRSTFETLVPNDYESVEYAEDYFLILRTLYQNSLPVVFEGSLAGISIREEGNTVTDIGANKWLVAKANVGYHLANNPSLTSGKFQLSTDSFNRSRRSNFLLARVARVLFDGRIWRMAFRSRVPNKLLSGQISIRYVLRKIKILIKQGW